MARGDHAAGGTLQVMLRKVQHWGDRQTDIDNGDSRRQQTYDKRVAKVLTVGPEVVADDDARLLERSPGEGAVTLPKDDKPIRVYLLAEEPANVVLAEAISGDQRSFEVVVGIKRDFVSQIPAHEPIIIVVVSNGPQA